MSPSPCSTRAEPHPSSPTGGRERQKAMALAITAGRHGQAAALGEPTAALVAAGSGKAAGVAGFSRKRQRRPCRDFTGAREEVEFPIEAFALLRELEGFAQAAAKGPAADPGGCGTGWG